MPSLPADLAATKSILCLSGGERQLIHIALHRSQSHSSFFQIHETILVLVHILIKLSDLSLFPPGRSFQVLFEFWLNSCESFLTQVSHNPFGFCLVMKSSSGCSLQMESVRTNSWGIPNPLKLWRTHWFPSPPLISSFVHRRS